MIFIGAKVARVARRAPPTKFDFSAEVAVLKSGSRDKKWPQLLPRRNEASPTSNKGWEWRN